MPMIAIGLLIFVGGHTTHCDMAEVNHVHDAAGCQRFVQLIAWEWLPDSREYHAQDWCYVETWTCSQQCVTYRYRDRDGKLRFRIYRETWTQHDPELDDRKLFNERYRVKVFKQ